MKYFNMAKFLKHLNPLQILAYLMLKPAAAYIYLMWRLII